ncbi:DUF5683 domain-containing protein [Algibacter luteus]|uniref:DUF5683 domain-containing protein n=1 Tax=Algibacter luteus TaxID=1178825 RepID=UPI00259478D9|nr:DUF5683 domain-containing protein [Algibacter luteus]WJJ97671.1 DUF5683 domain-containing protein [Algibacter luteus]
MQNKILITGIVACLLCCFSAFAQDKEKTPKKNLPKEVVIDTLVSVSKPIDALSPAKAAFYSAILPGLGQAYNKKYWKIPIVYGAIGTGIYFYIDNNKQYNRFRDAYKRRLAGYTDDEFYFDSQGNQLTTPRVSTDRLEDAQKLYRSNKEISLLVTIGFYALNIIDANVDAHLLQYNVDENLTLSPHYELNPKDALSNLGLTLNFKF